MRVDNFTNLKFGDKRDTIHITSLDLFTVGSVWVADMLHVPYGVCLFMFAELCEVYLSTNPSAPYGRPFGLPRLAGPLAAKLTRSKVSTTS